MPSHGPMRLVDRVFARLVVGLGVRLERSRDAIARSTLPRFASDAPGLEVRPPFEIRHPDRIVVGRDVKLGPNCVLKPVIRYPGAWLRHPEGDHVDETFDPELRIGDRVTATAGLQIAVFDRVTIEDDVMFAANVFIADGTHASTSGDAPYKYQGIRPVAPVHVGRGAWIGQNAVISPGVTIGRHAIVGANSVVTRDVPAGCVAVGAPASIVKRWDAELGDWRRDDLAEGGPDPTRSESEKATT